MRGIARVRARVTGLAMLLAGIAPRPVYACPVCFGQSDSPLASATNWGIVVLLAITGGVLSAFVGFFVYLFRRSRAALGEATSAARSVHQGGL
jgi:hypothetical protein